MEDEVQLTPKQARDLARHDACACPSCGALCYIGVPRMTPDPERQAFCAAIDAIERFGRLVLLDIESFEEGYREHPITAEAFAAAKKAGIL